MQKRLGQRGLLNDEGLTYLGGLEFHRIHAIGKIGHAGLLRTAKGHAARKAPRRRLRRRGPARSLALEQERLSLERLRSRRL